MSAAGTVLGGAWAALVLATMWPRRPLPAGRRSPAPPSPPSARPDVAAAVGRVVLALLARCTGDARRPTPADARRVGRAVLAAGAVALVAPAAAPGAGALVWAAPALPARRARRAHAGAVRRQLPEVVDLLALVTGAGLTVPLAVRAVAARAGGPVGDALTDVVALTTAGRRLVDALGTLPERLGDDARPLVAALVASERDGAPIAGPLERLAAELRHDRRRRAEAAARRVPVKLLFPLVACILPAFALLTVAPLLAGALTALRP